MEVTPFAKKILHSHVFHEQGKKPFHTTNLAATDCVAALCTVRHQQKVKTQYAPFWVGRTSTDISRTRLLSHLDKRRDIPDLYVEDYIPQGASQLLYDRFRQFHAFIEGRTALTQAWLELHLKRLDLSIKYLQLTTI